MFSNFQNNKYVAGTTSFLESNTIVAKFAFLVLVLIIFVIVLRIGSELIDWILSPSPNPHLLDGMVDAKHLIIFPQDPTVKNAVPILRSKNQTDGLTFTWSVWIHIDDMLYKDGMYKHVFHKGTLKNNKQALAKDSETSGGQTAPGLSFPNNAPGLYIAPNTNDLVIVMNTFEDPNEMIVVQDIPLNKWVNVIIRCDNKSLDVYINGTVVKRHVLSGVPRQNYDDVYIGANGGFDGYVSNLWYFDHALGTNHIESIVEEGPNLSMKGDNMLDAKPYYLSLRWFFMGDGGGYMPSQNMSGGAVNSSIGGADLGLPSTSM